VNLEGDRAVGYEPFMTGFERDRRAWGRPVDLRTLSDGSLLVSDDRAGAVYRVVYGG
jgi:glucose/arabinose dehydrogenase